MQWLQTHFPIGKSPKSHLFHTSARCMLQFVASTSLSKKYNFTYRSTLIFTDISFIAQHHIIGTSLLRLFPLKICSPESPIEKRYQTLNSLNIELQRDFGQGILKIICCLPGRHSRRGTRTYPDFKKSFSRSRNLGNLLLYK